MAAEVYWRGPDVDRVDTEATIQAACGLMEVHGRPTAIPHRLGVEVASVAAGVITTQGLLAAMFARLRGAGPARVETSVLHAGLFVLSHYLACATADDPEWDPPAQGDWGGPPFRTADGQLIEIEALDPEAWRRFWQCFDITAGDAGHAWVGFLSRYRTATCPLPPTFHQAIASGTLAELSQVAAETGVSLCRLRSHNEVVTARQAATADQRTGSVIGPPWRFQMGPDTAAPVPRQAEGEPARLPLAGVRVIEVGRRLHGPLAGLLLHLLGADVVRIEPPGGDLYRLMAPATGNVSALFIAFNRGKRAIELDIKRSEGRRILLDMVADADVFLHNWAPGKAAELRLDFDDLVARNPRLVYAHASGWGAAFESDPPFGTEYLVQAHSGLADAVRPVDEPQAPSPVTITDVMGALVASEGILAGLVRRERSGGRGCRVDSSLWSAALALQDHILDVTPADRSPRTNGRPVWGVLDRPLETADGYLQVEVDDERALRALAALCGVPVGGTSRESTEQKIAACIATRSSAAWEPLLSAANLVFAPVCVDLAELVNAAALAHLFQDIDGCRLPTAPWRFSA